MSISELEAKIKPHCTLSTIVLRESSDIGFTALLKTARQIVLKLKSRGLRLETTYETKYSRNLFKIIQEI